MPSYYHQTYELYKEYFSSENIEMTSLYTLAFPFLIIIMSSFLLGEDTVDLSE